MKDEDAAQDDRRCRRGRGWGVCTRRLLIPHPSFLSPAGAVLEVGLEPTTLAGTDFKSVAYASSAIRAEA